MDSTELPRPSAWSKLKPAVRKPWLILSAGLMWSGVGVLLCKYVYEWVTPLSLGQVVLVLFGGLILATMIYRFGFSHLADKNIRRIAAIPGEKACWFAFQEWKSYPLVAVMISMGIYLRVYSPFPEPLLAVMYLGIGGSLFLASLHYYRALRRRP